MEALKLALREAQRRGLLDKSPNSNSLAESTKPKKRKAISEEMARRIQLKLQVRTQHRSQRHPHPVSYPVPYPVPYVPSALPSTPALPYHTVYHSHCITAPYTLVPHQAVPGRDNRDEDAQGLWRPPINNTCAWTNESTGVPNGHGCAVAHGGYRPLRTVSTGRFAPTEPSHGA